MILEAIWESDFVEESIGYRPGRGAQQALLALRETLNDGSCRWVVEADIRGYFENIDSSSSSGSTVAASDGHSLGTSS
jgi:RNA-directed DNA polymerase